MTDILEQLKWESLKKGEEIVESYCFTKVWRVHPVYLRMTSPLPTPTPTTTTTTTTAPIRHVRKHHSLAFQIPFANTGIYKSSFFPQIIRDWNSLIDFLLSAAEGAEDSVAKLTSILRARD